MRKVLDVIWGERKQEYFCKQDWTGNAPDGQISPVGWVEPFAKPIIFANLQLMGIASLHPSYGPRFSSRGPDEAQRNPGLADLDSQISLRSSGLRCWPTSLPTRAPSPGSFYKSADLKAFLLGATAQPSGCAPPAVFARVQPLLAGYGTKEITSLRLAMSAHGAGGSSVGWVEPFAKPILFANLQLMGIASLHPSYGPGSPAFAGDNDWGRGAFVLNPSLRANGSPECAGAVIASEAKQFS